MIPRRYAIYALREVGSPLARYVGMTDGSASKRMTNHRAKSRFSDGTALARWINESGDAVEFVELFEVWGTRIDASRAERRTIAAFEAMAHPLLNVAGMREMADVKSAKRRKVAVQ